MFKQTGILYTSGLYTPSCILEYNGATGL